MDALELKELMTDGALTANRFVMQFMAICYKKVVTIGMPDVSALGVVTLQGFGWESKLE